MRSWKSAFVAVLMLAAAMPAAAEMWSWRTEDGGYAYTDDAKQIPARYRAQAKRVSQRSLGSYERLTVQDGDASARYADGVARRLESLRAANQDAEWVEQRAAAAAPPETFVMSTGGANA